MTRILSPLDLKVLRDLVRMRGQVVAIVAVIASGVGAYVGMRATMRSMDSACSNYFAHERFGDVFAGLKRAPERVADRLRAIPGVQNVQTRVVADVTLDVPQMVESAIGRLVSLPDTGRPSVNDIRLRSGRMPEVGRWNEVVVSEQFFEAHEPGLGAKLGAVINGKHEELTIVGTALSPEYIFAVGPGLIFPDDRRFGVIWMRRKALASAFDMEGAFNDVSLTIGRDVRVEEVLQRVDEQLERHGGLGSIARADQLSAFLVANELVQLRTFALLVPMLTLLVAAFLLNVIFGRVIAQQRGEIAALKAFGYRDREVGAHYAKLVGAVLATGCTLGLVVAAWLGVFMTRMYIEIYRFPELPFEMGAVDALQGVGFAAASAVLGTWTAIHRTVVVPPAEAMRPASPPAYRATFVERLGLTGFLPPSMRLVLREVERKPLRAASSILGIGMAMGLTVLNSFTFDSVEHMLNVQFGLNQREDVQLTLFEPRSTSALAELLHLPGVLHAEPHRNVPVRLRAGPRAETVSITGLRAESTLSVLLDIDLREIPLPAEGLVLSRKLAELLDIEIGQALRVEFLEGRRAEHFVPVARIVETFVGTSAHMELRALCRLLGESESFNGACLVADEAQTEQLHAEVKRTPIIAGATTRDSVWQSAQQMIDENLGQWVTISLSFSLVLAFGVLYNAVRITLEERARDLASLRVLGFRRREVTSILLGELALLVCLAVPLGLVIGRILAAVLAQSPGFNNEQFRLPLVIAPSTYALAIVTVLVAGSLSAWSAWRKLDRVDIVEVLKSND